MVHTVERLDSFLGKLINAQESGFLEKILNQICCRKIDDEDRVWESGPEYVRCTDSHHRYVVMFFPVPEIHKYDLIAIVRKAEPHQYSVMKYLPNAKCFETQEQNAKDFDECGYEVKHELQEVA